MIKKKLLYYHIFAGLFLYPCLNAQSDSHSLKEAIKFEALYTCDIVSNLKGGLTTGTDFLGMANINLLFDTQKAGLWKGTQVYFKAANTHGSMPSQEMIGDFQVISNIEAGNHTYFQELWIKQSIGKFEITAGLQDLNIEFVLSEYGGRYLNSSFGVLPVISGNFSAPIFPLTALAVTTKWKASEKTTFLAAVYDGSPTSFKLNPHNLKWQFLPGDGILAISELHHNILLNQQKGRLKLGIYTHHHFSDTRPGPESTDSLYQSITGAYIYADQQIWQNDKKSIGLFSQLGYSPSKTSLSDKYFGFGMNITGMFSKAGTDIIGLSVAHENFTNHRGSETSIELTYHRHITANFFIQPDLQYILSPSGKINNLNNCLAGILRIGLSF